MVAEVQRIIICDPNKDTREALQNTLITLESVVIESISTHYDGFPSIAEQHRPEVAIVTLDSDTGTAVNMIQTLAATCPEVNVVAASTRSDGRFIMDVLRRGAKEYITLPLELGEIVGALGRLQPGGGTGSGPQPRAGSKVVTFIGARGGVGCTSLAVNLGCTLAKETGASVCLIDLNLTMGDADVCLDLYPPVSTLLDVVLNIDRIDLQLLRGYLVKHKSSGLHLLAHPVNIRDSSLVRDDHINRIIQLLKLNFNYILVDLSKSYQSMEFAAMEQSDEILLTIQLDVSSLYNVLRLMQTIQERNGLIEKIRVIANRVGADGSEITIQQAQETIGREIVCQIPNDSRTMMASRNAGVPLIDHAPRSRLFQAIQELSTTLITEAPPAEKQEKGGGKWFNW